MYSQSKAQSSIEFVMITALILVLITIVFANYFAVESSTTAMVILGNALTERQAFTSTPFHVDKIDYVQTSDNSIELTVISPELGAMDPADLLALFVDSGWCDNIRSDIASKSSYNAGNITIHLGPISCLGIASDPLLVDSRGYCSNSTYCPSGTTSGWREFNINLTPVSPSSARGFHVAYLNDTGTAIQEWHYYDTYQTPNAVGNMISFIVSTIPDGRIVLVAVKDEGARQLDNSASVRNIGGTVYDAYDALALLGSSLSTSNPLCYRDSYALIGIKNVGRLAEDRIVSQPGSIDSDCDTGGRHSPGEASVVFN